LSALALKRALAAAAWLLCCLAACIVRAEPAAEFVLLWDPSQGGPQSAGAALDALRLSADDTDRYEVRYFEVAAPPDVPPGFAVIARERHKGGKSELTLKYRGITELPAAMPISAWHCALGAAAKKKDEVDVSIAGPGMVKRAYSRSCSTEFDGAAEFPPLLQAKPSSCSSRMVRLTAGRLKVEQWTLQPSGKILLEVSRGGRDSADDLAAFRSEVADKLIARAAVPLARRKSEAGDDCS